MFPPYKRVYKNKEDYLEVVVPLIQVEWTWMLEAFPAESLTQGRIVRVV